MIKYCIFDIDGTLLDSMKYWRSISLEFVYAQGVSQIPEELVEKTKYFSFHRAVYELQRDLNIPVIKPTEADMNSMMIKKYKEEIKAKPFVIEFLEMLKNHGVHMCAATATDSFIIEPGLIKTGIIGYFDFMITTSEIGKGKEKPDIFNFCIEKYNAKRCETVIFEDALYSIKTAKAAGYKVIAVEDDYMEMDKNEIIKISDMYISDYSELLKNKSFLENL